MKNIILLIAFLATIATSAQDFPAKRPELLKGKEVTISPLQKIDSYSAYKGFYTDAQMRSNYAPKGLGSTPDSLAGRTFRIESVEPYEVDGHLEAKMALHDNKGRTLYFKYDARFDKPEYFPFKVTGGLDLPADFYCDNITLVQREGVRDEHRSAIANGITFTKYRVDGEPNYMIEVRQFNEVLVSTPKNLILTLENGKMISKADATIGVVANASGYTYIATSHLTPAEVELLKNNKIISTKTHTFVREVTDGVKLKGMFGCLTTK